MGSVGGNSSPIGNQTGPLPSLLGTAGGVNGTGIQGPQGTTIYNPASAQQIQGQYSQTASNLQDQQNLLAALQNQRGLQNQNQVYGQLQNIAAGQGPNPAQAMLNQQTGQNIANQAALMAGQRGASQNVGLLARQAAQQGANTQQQAVGQGATMQAQQSLNALTGAGNMANTMAGNQIGQTNANAQAQQNFYNSLVGANQGANSANVGMQSNINNVNGQLANTQLQGQQAMIGGMMNMMSGSSMLAGAEGGDVDSMPDTSTPTFASDSGADAFSKKSGSGGGGALSLLALLAGGGMPEQTTMQIQPMIAPGPQSSFGQIIQSQSMPDMQVAGAATPSFGSDAGAQALQEGMTSAGKSAKKMFNSSGSSQGSGGAAGRIGQAMSASGGGMAKGGKVDYRSGGHVKAQDQKQKAVAPGNSYANDKIPAVLSEHEIVIPRNITMGKDPINNSAKFVAAILAKRKARA